jgi:predicted DNA-binding transcriptional regulator AlpA
MKRYLIAAAIIAGTLATTAMASDVGVSVSIGQPGFYGRIDVGDFPRPVVLYRQPRVIEVVPASRPPIYMRVPPGHARHWDKHCYKYGACGERVYFVRDEWYQREYVPRYQERHSHRRDRYDDHRHGNDRRDDWRDGRHDGRGGDRRDHR